MKNSKNILLLFSLIIAGASARGPVSADEIKLKSGQTLTGTITYEADDIVKIEVPISASIKETKIIGRADIETITKDAPDDVEFNKIQKLVPTGSMVPVDAYRKMLDTGPEPFLKNFPGSKHAPKVKEIRDTLAGELDKVERGYIKLEDEWFSPQEKIDHKELLESRVRLLRMENAAMGGKLNNLISAMREFEAIEESYYGTPAFPKAVELAKEIVPNLGRQLQNLASNLDYQNAEYERALAASTPEARTQLTAARAREDKILADNIAADKKAGVKWTQLNPRNKQSVEAYLKLAGTELARIGGFDTALLSAQAEVLVAVDKLIAEDKIGDAKLKLAEASAMTGQTIDSKTKSKSKSKGSSKSGSYMAALGAKISERISEEEEKAKAKAAASESEALTANLKKSESGKEGDAPPVKEGEAVEPGAMPADGETPKATAEVDEFAALASPKRTAEPAGEKGSSARKSKTKQKEKIADDDEEGEEEKGSPRPAPVVEEEGGLSFSVIAMILTALLVITVVVLKVLGIGGKKSDD